MIAFTVNGRERTVDAPPLTPLSTVLREALHLTGTKVACEEGFCGACTVLVDDEPATSCLVPIAHVAGRSVRTVETGDPVAAARAHAGELTPRDGIEAPGWYRVHVLPTLLARALEAMA